jgi:ABC-type nickel/cobalt efflux system permease component RcnA
VIVSGLVLVPAGVAAAHPLGSFTVNIASVLRVQPGKVHIDVVIDMAEIPATQARPEVDAAGPEQWRERECGRLGTQAALTVDGRQRPLVAAGGALTFPPGAGGLSTLRLVCRYVADTGGGGAATAAIAYELRAYTDRIGWREVVAIGDHMTLVTSDVPAHSPSRLLTSYPSDPLTSPSDVTRASLTVRAGGSPAEDPLAAELGTDNGNSGGNAGGNAGTAANDTRPGGDGLTARFAGLAGNASLSWGIGLLALVAAVGLGAAHAFAPGHGKTVMAARIAGGSASGRQLAAMALAVTLTHTLGVFLLAVALSASAGFAPEQLYPWLGVASGLLLVVLGLNLLRTRLGVLPRGRRRPAPPHSRSHGHYHSHGEHHSHGDDSHGHHHLDRHGHGDGHRHPHGEHHFHGVDVHGHAHSDDGHHLQGDDALSHRHPHGHDHSDGHHHSDGDDAHSGGDDAHGRHSHGHDLLPGTPVGHTHGGRWHTHSFGENPPRLRDLLAVGFVGGMVPTPSAVVVLLGAVALGRAWFGVLLVLAYGAGMAATLVGVGFLFDRALQPLLRGAHKVAPSTATVAVRWVPVASAGVIVLVGAILALHAGTLVTT